MFFSENDVDCFESSDLLLRFDKIWLLVIEEHMVSRDAGRSLENEEGLEDKIGVKHFTKSERDENRNLPICVKIRFQSTSNKSLVIVNSFLGFSVPWFLILLVYWS